MRVLGIETSCDETAVAVVEAPAGAGSPVGRILANVVYSQLTEHRRFGGVVPEIAARAHLERIDGLVEPTRWPRRRLGLADLDGIAATGGPGLIGGVMVGVMTAKATGLRARQAVPRHQSSRRPCAVGAAHRAGRLSLPAAAGLGRPLPAPDGARPGRLHAARHHHRRCGRRMLRQDRQASGPGLSRRAGGRAAGARTAIRSASPCRGRCGASRAATSPSPASRRRCARPSRSSTAGRSRRRVADLCASFQRTVGDVLADRCANALALAPIADAGRGGRRRRQPLSARPARRRRPPARRASGRAAGQALHRQRRHDRLGRHRAAAARPDRRARFHAAAALAARRIGRAFGCRLAP